MTISGTEIYKRTATYEKEAPTIRLHAPQWKLLLAFDGQRSLTDVASGAALSFGDAQKWSDTFVKKNWLEEQPISLEEYLKRASAGGNFTGGVIPSSVVVPEPPESRAEMGRDVLPPPLAAASPAARPATTPLPPPRELPPAIRRTMKLAAVVDYIVSLAETVALGRLLTYRVFLRVPPEILQAEDIVSIRLADDASVVRGEPLQKAIAAAVQEIVKRPLPDSVFAPA